MSEPTKKSLLVKVTFAVVIIGLFAAVFLYLLTPNYDSRSTRPDKVCIINLREIDAAKNEWALENGKTNGAVCTENDINPYIKLDAKGNLARCPMGGIYTIGKVGEPPTCSLGTTVDPPHVLQ